MAVHDDGQRTVSGSGQQGEKGSHGGVAVQKQGEMSISLHERNVKRYRVEQPWSICQSE